MNATVNNNKNVFITGANGMLGSSICKELVKQGYRVKGLILNGSQRDTLDQSQIELVEGNILDKDFLLEEMRGCNYVIHAAAHTSIWPRRSETVVNVNYVGTRNVMEVAETLQLKRMVHIGTASTFGHGTKENPGDENSPYLLDKYGVDYMNSKRDAQQMLLDKHAEKGFPVIIVNPTFMIGPFDSGPSSGKMIIAVVQDKLPAFPTGGKNFISSTDVSAAVVNALVKGRLGECYVLGNENLDYGEFFKKVCEVSNKPFKLKKAPNVLIQGLGALNSVNARISGKTPGLSYTTARLGALEQYYSSHKAQNELDLKLTPIEVGIKQCIGWFEMNGYIK